MSELKSRTKGNSSPQGKPRVYFSCHPADFDMYFEDICKDIFNISNCAIYYEAGGDTGTESGGNFGDLNSYLSEMQLFIVPITSNYLFKDSRAKSHEYGFAISHNIPIVPIVVESGIEVYFEDRMNRISAGFGDIQFINKTSTDVTEISYAEKLKKQIESILIGDELAERVRAAFDAYIFLSYRKKDRESAQDLMRLIHRIPYCEDIAIWYDEFLNPGEKWSDAIAEALEKSSLVTLAVTPNLLEEDNYIIKYEYPQAIGAGKKIVPAQLKPTDRAMLERLFEGIPAVWDGKSVEEMAVALQRIARRENDSSDEHKYLMGLAYLGGIDMERDNEKALSLITAAAKAGLFEAMDKLVSMYNTGNGVVRDYYKAVEWQEKLVDEIEKAVKRRKLKIGALVETLMDLGEMWYALGNMPKAKTAYTRMQEYAQEQYRKNRTLESYRNLARSYNNIGIIFKAEGDLKKAKEYFLKSLKIGEEIEKKGGTGQSRSDLLMDYYNVGGIYKAEGNQEEAKKYYLKSLSLSEKIAAKSETIESRRNLSVSCISMGDSYKAEGKLAEAKVYYLRALKLREAILAESETIESRRSLVVNYDRIGSIYEAEGKRTEAKSYYIKSLILSEGIARETETLQSLCDLAVSYNIIAGILKAEGNTKEAKDFYIKLLRLREKIVATSETLQSRRDLTVSYNKIGDICWAEGNIKAAREYFLKALKLLKEIEAENGPKQLYLDLIVTYNNIGDAHKAEGNLAEAKEYYLESLRICEEFVAEIPSTESHYNLAICYDNVGHICGKEGKPTQAREYYLKSLQLRERIVAESDVGVFRRDLINNYIYLCAICIELGNSIEAKPYLVKAYDLCIILVTRFPNNKEYAKMFEEIKKMIGIHK